MEFERTLDDDPWNESFHEEPRPITAVIGEKLSASRRHPEVIYLSDEKNVVLVQDLLISVYGQRGSRIPVLHDPKEREPFTIRWGV